MIELAEKMSPQYGGFLSFIDCCCQRDSNVSTVGRFLWRAYRNHCVQFGYPSVDGKTFVRFLREEPGVSAKVFKEARGKLRTHINGVYVSPNARPLCS